MTNFFTGAPRHTRINPLNAELNPICYFLALLAHHFLHVSRIRVQPLTLRLLMSYIYIYDISCHIYIYDISSLRVNIEVKSRKARWAGGHATRTAEQCIEGSSGEATRKEATCQSFVHRYRS